MARESTASDSHGDFDVVMHDALSNVGVALDMFAFSIKDYIEENSLIDGVREYFYPRQLASFRSIFENSRYEMSSDALFKLAREIRLARIEFVTKALDVRDEMIKRERGQLQHELSDLLTDALCNDITA